eukprot:5189870-Alexandrium_andersonii.AAC.1
MKPVRRCAGRAAMADLPPWARAAPLRRQTGGPPGPLWAKVLPCWKLGPRRSVGALARIARR